MMDLKPCPFCGKEAEIERLGTPRQSTIYQCGWCAATLETGEEWGHGTAWNTRPREDALQAEVERLREALKPFADFRLGGFEGATVLEVTRANPDNPASRIEPIWTIHFQNARAALKGAHHE